jgi:hypothetical protein
MTGGTAALPESGRPLTPTHTAKDRSVLTQRPLPGG